MKVKYWYYLIEFEIRLALGFMTSLGSLFLYQQATGHMMSSLLLLITTSFLTTGVVNGLINFEKWFSKHAEADDDR
jgi:hypothetical protein